MNYYNQIKEQLISNEVYKKVKDYSKNRSDLETYYNVGKLLVEAQGGEARAKYGDGLIKEYSKKLVSEIGKQYNYKTLFKMRKFYLVFQKVSTLSRQLTWSHCAELLKFEDINEINYYLKMVEEYNLSVRELRDRIKSEEYERLDDNAKQKLLEKQETNITDLTKNPIIIRNSHSYERITEKTLKRLILEDISNFMKELGDGFSFVDDEYKIKLGNRYNYIDILLFNIKYNCYVVVELKITELKKEYIGQIEVYMNYIDKHVKTIGQDKTIGIIICRKDNHFVMQYCSDDRIYMTTYKLEATV